MRVGLLAGVLVLAGRPLPAEVEIRVAGNQVSLHAVSAPVSEILDGLARRGLFLQPLAGDPGWYVLHGLIREYARANLALDADETPGLHRRAAA